MLYVHRIPEQTKAFAAEIRYYAIEKCVFLLRDSLTKYNRWTFEFDELWSDDMKTEYRKDADTAFTTFRTLLCDTVEFESQGAAEQYLNDYKDAVEEVLEFMATCVEEHFEDHDKDDGAGIVFVEADTLVDLNAGV